MSILLFSNDKCFYCHILVHQGRIQNDEEEPRKERTTDIQSSKYIRGWRLSFRQDLDAGSAAKSMTMGSPAGPGISSYCASCRNRFALPGIAIVRPKMKGIRRLFWTIPKNNYLIRIKRLS